jgi:hypothetical protein
MNEMEIPTDLASKCKLAAARTLALDLGSTVCMEKGKQSWRALPKHQHKCGLEPIWKLFPSSSVPGCSARYFPLQDAFVTYKYDYMQRVRQSTQQIPKQLKEGIKTWRQKLS